MARGVVPSLFLCLFVLSASAQDMTVSFSISVNHTGRAFRQFILDVRAMLREPDRPFVMQDTGRLPRQEDVPTRFMDIELRTVSSGITLRMRTDNLYVVGFRNGIGQGTWFELTGFPQRVIPDSTMLAFGGDYRSDGLGQVTESTQVGRGEVEFAIDALAEHGNGSTFDDSSLKLYLRTLIVHFVESMRLTDVAERVARTLSAADEENAEPPGGLGVLENLIHNWSLLSKNLYIAANDVVQDQSVLAKRFEKFQKNGIYNAFKAAQALGLALLANSYHRRPKRSVEDNPDHVFSGLMLVQVTEVIVRRIDDEDPGDLYGSIAIDDGIGSQQLFQRDRSDSQSVGPGGQAQLTGADRAVSAADGFAVDFDLMDKDSYFPPDDNVSNGLVEWNSFVVASDQYDVLQSRIIDGANGQVELRFAVMTDAVVATVEVVILDSSEDTPNVYGTITATMNLDDGTPVTIELMRLSRDQQVGVAKGSAVPLQRKVVAVPTSSDSEMQVGGILSDRNLLNEDEQIAAGFFTFQNPRLTGEDSGELSGDKGRVKVRVTWSSWFD